MRDDAGAEYQLIALHDGSTSDQLRWRHLGRYGDLDQAVRARIDDVLAQLAGHDGWRIHVQHLIVGPGPDGPATVHCFVTDLGPDPADDVVPEPHDEPALRRWLLAAHALTD
jgi:hypothetical protein